MVLETLFPPIKKCDLRKSRVTYSDWIRVSCQSSSYTLSKVGFRYTSQERVYVEFGEFVWSVPLATLFVSYIHDGDSQYMQVGDFVKMYHIGLL